MARITRALTLGHRANLGEEVEQISLAEGEEVVILATWDDRYLCRNDAGQQFHVPKDAVEAS